MSEHPNSVLVDDDVELRSVEAFRRATFNWALSTKKMVDIAASLGNNQRVAHTALVDIEYARELLENLFLPQAVKTPISEGAKLVTAAEVKATVSRLISRVRKTPFNARVEPSKGKGVAAKLPTEAELAMGIPITRDMIPGAVPKPERKRQAVDLSAPVHSRNGKMLWADIDCPSCPAKASQRCQKDDGGFVEKPHVARDNLAKQAPNT